MSVVVTTPGAGQSVIVNAGPQLTSLGTETTALNTTEQTICQRPGGDPSQVTGYIDLAELLAGDTVIITFYVRLTITGPWRACYKENYVGVQSLPVVHVAKRPEKHGLKVTAKQVSGIPKNITCEFFEES